MNCSRLFVYCGQVHVTRNRHFKVNNPGARSAFMMSPAHRLYLVLEHSYPTKEDPHPCQLSSVPSPRPWGAHTHFPSLDFPVLDVFYHWDRTRCVIVCLHPSLASCPHGPSMGRWVSELHSCSRLSPILSTDGPHGIYPFIFGHLCIRDPVFQCGGPLKS